jgi:NitT/TauT family transport system ATP-binding protein
MSPSETGLPAAAVPFPAKTTAPPAIDIRNIQKVYLSQSGKVVEAIADVSLSIRQSAILAVIGPSGCGKSSLLRIMAGLDSLYDGEILWALNDAAGQTRRSRSATVFQGDSTLPWMTSTRFFPSGVRA